MPEVAEIKGLSLQMLYRDHEPVHLHVYKHEDELAVITIDGTIRRGHLEKDKLKAIREWIADHQDELNDCWLKSKQGLKIERIK